MACVNQETVGVSKQRENYAGLNYKMDVRLKGLDSHCKISWDITIKQTKLMKWPQEQFS